MYTRIKQESIQVEDVREDDYEDKPTSLTERDSVSPMASLGRGKILRVPSQMLIPMMKVKQHDEGVYEGVGSPQVKSIRV